MTMSGDKRCQVIQREAHGHRTAFTLIELLVVISVIVMLMAILVPTLRRARNYARSVGCQSNLRQWGLFFSTHVASNNGTLFGPTISHDYPYDTSHYDPFLLLKSYWWDCNDVLRCPATRVYQPNQRPPGFHPADRAWKVPLADYAGPSAADNGQGPSFLYGSYGANRWLGGRPNVDRWLGPQYWRSLNLKKPQNIPLLCDCALPVTPTGIGPEGLGHPPVVEGHTWDTPAGLVCIDRHAGGINSVFLDGSVRKIGLKQLWGLKWDRMYDTANCWTRRGGVLPEDWPPWMARFKDD
jgi:prepilin-type N-terminal cleavage/methylation domain-containing protein/prepilin-type processing-associated H-X9-DG protein